MLPNCTRGCTSLGFCAAAGHVGVLGVQFHPEKSSVAGLGLLSRWLAVVRAGVVSHS